MISENIMSLSRRLADMKDQFTAAFVTSDQIASYLVQGLRNFSVRIPEDVSIVSFDNLALCQQITPQLTTISQNLVEKATCAVDILFRHLQDKQMPAESLILDVSLIERNSVIDRNLSV